MSRLRVHCFSVSFDGYSAGLDQDLANPAGVGGLPVFGWQFATRTAHQMHGSEGGATGLDDDMVVRGFEGIGAWIMHFVLSPVPIGSGERLFDDLNLPGAGYELKDHIASPGATHVMVAKRK
jgi:hypothetical protein